LPFLLTFLSTLRFHQNVVLAHVTSLFFLKTFMRT
jgi:hypothetical protein